MRAFVRTWTSCAQTGTKRQDGFGCGSLASTRLYYEPYSRSWRLKGVAGLHQLRELAVRVDLLLARQADLIAPTSINYNTGGARGARARAAADILLYCRVLPALDSTCTRLYLHGSSNSGQIRLRCMAAAAHLRPSVDADDGGAAAQGTDRRLGGGPRRRLISWE